MLSVKKDWSQLQVWRQSSLYLHETFQLHSISWVDRTGSCYDWMAWCHSSDHQYIGVSCPVWCSDERNPTNAITNVTSQHPALSHSNMTSTSLVNWAWHDKIPSYPYTCPRCYPITSSIHYSTGQFYCLYQVTRLQILFRDGTCYHLISRTVVLVANSSSWALRLGSLCKPTQKRRLGELYLSSALQILDLIDWLIDYVMSVSTGRVN